MGYNLIKRIHRFEEKAHELGFRLAYPRHSWNDRDSNELVALYPRDEELPIYARDAELYAGTLSDAEEFLIGIEWAREYDRMLKVSTKAKRDRKEQDERNRKLARILKEEPDDSIGGEFVTVATAKP